VIELPTVPLSRALQRAGSIWGADAAAHHVLLGQSGSGKTTLAKHLLGLCESERVLILDPKPHTDPIWNGPADDPQQWGRPVTDIGPRFGYEGQPGGGPGHLWYRLTGSPDRADTARRFAAALAIVQTEGHCILVLDDVRELRRQLRLAEDVDSVMNLGRSANVLAILSATETSYVSGRQQAAMTWIGHTSGLNAAKDGANLLGHSGRTWYETTAAVQPHQWIYADSQPGSAGPVLAV
jgi:hypothetical protein